MSYQENYQKWVDFVELPDYLRQDLENMDEKTKEDAFYTNLEFGTAGMRGLVGAGTNRINIYVVRQATEGLARLIESKGGNEKERGVAIAYDSRHFSPEFAFESAAVLAKHGIKSYVFESLRPTPELSFAVRHLNCFAGIMVTASHNPAPFNGYKVYGEDGGQMPPHDADALTTYIRAIENPFAVEVADVETEKASGLIEVIGEAVDIEYLKEVKDININPALIEEFGKDMKIVYTPLHGTGEMLARRALAQAGFDSVQVVEAQATADPDFSTVTSPNPESQAAFALAEELGRQVGADVLVATDPDADRVGVEVLQKDGSYLNLSGNQIGAIMAKYILEAHKNAGTLPENAALCKSIVSTDLVTKIAESYGATMFNVLTGFKFIAEKIQEFEEKHNHTYMMGFEESFGYLIKPFVRDKDAIQAVLVVAELAAYYRSRGLTLADGIEEIYKEYGYYAEKTISVTLSGVDGAEQIKAIMAKFRNNAPTEWNATAITVVEDFKAQTATVADGTVTNLTTPPSDVLKYTLADGSWIAVRPSGTEPKIKFYIAVVGETNEESQAKIANIEAEINAFVK
ncbi:phosphoglucomutase [Streptococcus pneumoniae]|jgi:alpha-phosphoglucomutase (EC 5.4.2.2)|uniref:Phosphoglucomutase n=7 Tax=Streptococcus pneumoniae TaxID=1313 RepID=Q8DP52_STRR6|nr:phospho-sugar mutase [Streptococcus pneumoniae]EDK71093.1 phosphoglucomutase/phosphomannomutase family protein [Streptococcus pneumoniae SP19-BS75]EGI84311.1 phosphoglucomutase/phosphomannomutase, C-terminal domain protein [Streptococcus pneumoniae GA41301]EGJ14131.1 phosphoglucomutase/phosphomannomutase, C-terminal domain protein [Streptococcus pneumoniae GA47368]EHD27121.1 phosphoglucomutase/phosphomannomutase, C-terminal domain protein [Streptococcus pneumoniae 4027-06]EHD29048.1 phospho